MLAGIAAYFHIYNDIVPKNSEETHDLNKKSVDDDSVFGDRVLNFWQKLNLIRVEGSGSKTGYMILLLAAKLLCLCDLSRI